MDAAAISALIGSFLQVAETILPMLGPAGNAMSVVATVITALEKIVPVISQLAPLVGNEASLLYQGVKNIIANLKGTGTTTADQDAALDALDALVDSEWDSVAAQFDPDYARPVAGAS